MSSKSELRAHRRELLKAIVHTYLKCKGEATIDELYYFINENGLLPRSSVNKQGLSTIISTARFKKNPKRFKKEEGFWRLNV